MSSALKYFLLMTAMGVLTISWLFPMISSLGFTGNIFNAICTSAILNVAAMVLVKFSIAVLRKVGLMDYYETGGRCVALVVGVLANMWTLTQLNGHFGVHVNSAMASLVGAVVVTAMECLSIQVYEALANS